MGLMIRQILNRSLFVFLIVAATHLVGCSFLWGGKPTQEDPSRMFVLQTRAAYYMGKLAWPAPKTKISSKFGERNGSPHEGVDLSGKEGLPVYAAHAGKVVYSGNKISGYGNIVVLLGKYDLTTVYAHNKVNLVKVGSYVGKGDKIAILGRTGNASGPHVHFETRVRDSSGKQRAVNPLVFYR